MAIYKEIQELISTLEPSKISNERKEVLNAFAEYIQDKIDHKEEIK